MLLSSVSKLLIVPEGIEMRGLINEYKTALELLIVPEGIEIIIVDFTPRFVTVF